MIAAFIRHRLDLAAHVRAYSGSLRAARLIALLDALQLAAGAWTP